MREEKFPLNYGKNAILLEMNVALLIVAKKNKLSKDDYRQSKKISFPIQLASRVPSKFFILPPSVLYNPNSF